MIDIPLNKALVVVEAVNKQDCKNCDAMWICDKLTCTDDDRRDGKNVVFKLVDLPEVTS